jgi:hypothetical protein
MSVPTASPATSSRGLVLPRGPVLVALAYAVGVLGPILVLAGVIAFTDEDPYAPQGPVESMVGIAIFGTIALALALGIALGLGRSPSRAGVAAVILGVLSVVSLVFFWSGAPAVFGACAAWCAGLTRDRRPLGGAARVAGIVGAFVVLFDLVLVIGGFTLAAVAA